MINYKTTIISDLHLGSKSSRRDDIIQFLDNLKTEVLILNGDIIDGWSLQRGSKWTKKDSKIVRKILKMSETGTKVVWVRGNHDDFIKDFIPIVLGDIKMVEDYIIHSNNKKYYVFHGDVLDVFITKTSDICELLQTLRYWISSEIPQELLDYFLNSLDEAKLAKTDYI